MAFVGSTPSQFDRDMRGAHKDFKRYKDASRKWAYGTRPLSGHRGQKPGEDKCRPLPKFSNSVYKNHNNSKPNPNIVKCTRNGGDGAAPFRFLWTTQARLEVRDARADDTTWSASPVSPDSGSGSGILYSFDNTDSPPPALTLDLFIKPNVRATEKLVEKEYQVLDGNGEAVKGRKARQVLRKAASSVAAPVPQDVMDDDDFELV